MKRTKQILAILLIIILAALYVSSLVFAIIGNDRAMDWLKTSIYATIVLPVLLWIYIFLYQKVRDTKNRQSKWEETDVDTDETKEEE